MARSTDEWIGKTDDHRAPGKVRDRIMARDKRICHLCHCEIQVGQNWDLDHVKALINGGENRETNLRPAHRKCHVDKTAQDVAEKAKVAAIRMKHLGITKPKQKIPSKNDLRTKPPRDPNKGLPPLPRNNLYEAKP